MNFAIKVISLVVSFISLLALFNWYADPYDFWRSGYTSYKDYDGAELRLYHPIRISQSDFDYIFIGSSRTRHGYIPGLYQPGVNAYNASFDGATSYELGRFMSFIAHNSKPRAVIVGIDFFRFAPNLHMIGASSNGPIGGRSLFLTKLSSAVSLKTTLASYKVLQFDHMGHKNSPPRIFTWNPFKDTRRRFESHVTVMAGDYFGQFNPEQPAVDPAIMKSIADGATALAAKGIKVIFIINPLHAAHLKLVHDIGLAGHYERIVDDLITITNDIEKKYPAEAELWDFSECKDVVREAIPLTYQGRMKYFYDSTHIKPTFGELIWHQVIGRNLFKDTRYIYEGAKLAPAKGEPKPFKRHWEDCHSSFDFYVSNAIKDTSDKRCKMNYEWCTFELPEPQIEYMRGRF